MDKKLSQIDFKDFEKRKRAAFVNSLSGFKSANLIGTISEKGQSNLSIVSSVFHLGADPALLGFIIRPDISPRHTLDNIRQTGFCTLNHVNEKIWKKAHQTSARYPEEVSEFDACQLSEIYVDDFKAPFVAESNLRLALKFIREVSIKENGTHMLIMEIEHAYLDQQFISESGFVDIEGLGSVAVSGLDSYHKTSRLGRLSYAKTDRSPSVLSEK
ncbi:flavin reductase family protein [Bacteriovorax sp. DB6_IX]|uniref:flavin reductase family protein n=1 Tax=Bacteriovorax sp. DB6_IX TaxID=1353530 RepID=UPI000389EC0B|nr:flavin reductase [Bacteriovorax sp. DB6_IX]EQC44130.1 flavin reductase-like protein [Bacteriovorax sp. DB6_IX]